MNDTPPSSDEALTHFGYERVAVSEKAGKVAEVFHSVADKYDVMNDLISFGSHRILKRITLEMSAVRPGHKVLDLAGGTGDMAKHFINSVGDSGEVVLADINSSMLSVGRDRLLNQGYFQNLRFVQADAETLPFPDNYFNCVCIAYGLRNVTHKDTALKAMTRVLKPGGRLIVLEFSHVVNPIIKPVYEAYSKLWPKIGQMVTGDSDSYVYLRESIRMHPKQDELKAMLEQAGLSLCRYHNLIGGAAAIHYGVKP